jgi:hypothetical protein
VFPSDALHDPDPSPLILSQEAQRTIRLLEVLRWDELEEGLCAQAASVRKIPRASGGLLAKGLDESLLGRITCRSAKVEEDGASLIIVCTHVTKYCGLRDLHSN